MSGESYILDDFLLAGQVGLDLHAMLDLPLELYGSVTRVEGSSLYFQLRAVHPFTPYEYLSLSVGWLHDTRGSSQTSCRIPLHGTRAYRGRVSRFSPTGKSSGLPSRPKRPCRVFDCPRLRFWMQERLAGPEATSRAGWPKPNRQFSGT